MLISAAIQMIHPTLEVGRMSMRYDFEVLTQKDSMSVAYRPKPSLIGRDRHGYGNTRGVLETGHTGTGTVCKMLTRGYTATRTAVSRVCTGIRSKKNYFIYYLIY